MATSGSFNTSGYSASDGSIYLVFSWTRTAVNIEDNTSTISWTLKGGGTSKQWFRTGGMKVVIDGATAYQQGSTTIAVESGKTIASGTKTIKHNADGSRSFEVSVSGGIYYYTGNNASGSKTFTIDTIPRASQPTCITYPENTQNVGNFGATISIHMNRKSSEFTHRVRYAFGTASGTCIDAETGKAATAVENGFKWKIPESFMNQLPASTSGSGTIYADTYKGSELIGTKYCGFTAEVGTGVKPTVTFTLEDVSGAGDIYGKPVQGLSKIKIVTTATPAYSSPIASYTITANGAKYSTAAATTGVLTASGSSPVTVTVKDKRGRTGTASYTMDVLAYNPPQISKLTVHRCGADGVEDDQGDHIKVVFSAALSAMSNKNTAAYTIKYKKTSATSYTAVTLSALANDFEVNSYAYIFAADINSTYDVELTVADRHNSASRATSASSAFSLLNFGANGTSVAFGKAAEKERAVEFALEMYDKYDTIIANGRASYTGSGDNAIDPNTTVDHLVLTNKNVPLSGMFYYVKTEFYSTKTPTSNRSQFALPYASNAKNPYFRYYYNGTWSAWEKLITLSDAWPVGSIHIRYDKTNPGTLFGGTWAQISNAFLWGIDSTGSIGVTGGEKTHVLTVNELPEHTHGSVYSQHADGTKSRAWYTASGTSLAYGGVATGGGQAHNNMPPYIQVAIWRRTK